MDTPMTPPPFPPEDEDTLPGGEPPKSVCKASHLEILAFAEVAKHLKGIREGYAVTNVLIEGTNKQLRDLVTELRGVNRRVDALECQVKEHDRLIEDLRRRVG